MHDMDENKLLQTLGEETYWLAVDTLILEASISVGSKGPHRTLEVYYEPNGEGEWITVPHDKDLLEGVYTRCETFWSYFDSLLDAESRGDYNSANEILSEFLENKVMTALYDYWIVPSDKRDPKPLFFYDDLLKEYCSERGLNYEEHKAKSRNASLKAMEES